MADDMAIILTSDQFQKTIAAIFLIIIGILQSASHVVETGSPEA